MNQNNETSNQKVSEDKVRKTPIKKSTEQEIFVRKSLENLSFSENEINNIINKLNISKQKYTVDVKKITELLTKEYRPTVTKFFYTSIDERNGSQVVKYRELDCMLRFFFIYEIDENRSKEQIKEILTFYFIGDVKGNEGFQYEFLKDIVFLPEYQFPFFVETGKSISQTTQPYTWDKSFPLPFPPVSNIQVKEIEKNKKSRRNKDYSREFFNQVCAAIDSKLKTIEEDFTYGNLREYNIVVPMLITETKPVYISHNRIKSQEVDAVLYFFLPTYPQKSHTYYLVPILVVHQNAMEHIMKKLIITLLARYFSHKKKA